MNIEAESENWVEVTQWKSADRYHAKMVSLLQEDGLGADQHHLNLTNVSSSLVLDNSNVSTGSVVDGSFSDEDSAEIALMVFFVAINIFTIVSGFVLR